MPPAFARELDSIPMSPNLAQGLERAHQFAREQSHRAVTLEHLLLALTEDAEAAVILQSANVDLARLSTDVSGYLGGLLEDMRGDGASEPRPDAELLRVMQAAASAARQSRRKQIDGAIVLAAIVGDGKSPAAGMLKSLGMTFEEAIRALQRANTKARLKPTPKPVPASPAAVTQPAAPPRTEEKPSDPPPEPVADAPTHAAEDFLAAARARIQRRSSAPTPSETPPGPAAPAASPETAVADDEPALPPVEPAETQALTQAIEAAMTSRSSGPAPASPPAPEAPEPPPQAAPSSLPVPPQSAPPAWTPPPEARPSVVRMPQPAPRAQPPLPGRPIAAAEGPRRPPLPPQRPAATLPPPPTLPSRAPRAPWPDPAEPVVRPPLPNGALPEPPPAAPAERPSGRPPAPGRAAGPAEKGLLVESVPRRMRVGVPASAEVRISRDRIDTLIAALSGRGAQAAPEQSVTRALSVRLRAPGGDFWIEPATPETQWAENASNLIHDDYAVWRWTVVAQRRGRGRLALMVSARTVGRDGVAAEQAPPDRVIEVKVRSNHRQRLARWTGLLIAVLLGGIVGRFSDQLWSQGLIAIKRALGN